MTNTDSYKNPFLDYNANTYSEEDILKYWYSPFNTIIEDVSESDLFEDSMPYFLSGHRGSGKTMILKYMSYPCQKMMLKTSANDITYLEKLKSLSVYIRLDTSAIMNMNIVESETEIDVWKRVFIEFFELNIFYAILDFVKNLIADGIVKDFELDNLCLQIGNLLKIEKCDNLDIIENQLSILNNEIDNFRSNQYFESSLVFNPKCKLGEKSASFKLIDIITENIKLLKNKKIVLAIDEFENYNEIQQQYINNLVKFCNSTSGSNTNFRIGFRTGGIWSSKTFNDNEFLRENFDYRMISINQYMGNNKAGLTKYKNFLINIAEKRLSEVNEFRMNGFTNIEAFLLKSENWEEESKNIVGNEKKHFKLINKLYDTKANKDLISNPDKPLQEVYNIIRLNKGEDANTIKRAMYEFNNSLDTDLAKKYNNDYINKYRYNAVFLLCNIYRKPKLYYSFNTFAYLSSGSVRTFINLCRETFALASFENIDSLLNGQTISKEIQTRAASKISQIEVEMIKPIKGFGTRLSNLVNGLGNEFKRLHQDPNLTYPETNQFAFGYSIGGFEEKVINTGLVWSVLLKKEKNQQITIGEKKGVIYTINRIYSPYFQLSYRTRGGKNLVFYNNNDFFHILENGEYIESLTQTVKKDENPNQLSIFDEEDF